MTETVRDFQPGQDDAGVLALWDRCFGAPRGGQTLDWLFRSSPAGACPRSVVEHEGRIIAHAGVSPQRFRLFGEEARGAYSVAAMTDPEQRGRGLFVKVGRHLYARLEREGFAFVAGFANANSHRLMTGPLGREPIGPFPWCIRILRPLRMLRSLLGGEAPPPGPAPTPRAEGALRALPCPWTDERLDALWPRVETGVRIGCVRDAAFATYRFGSRPDVAYRALLVERSDRPTAWAVYRFLPIRGLLAAFLVDFQVAADDAPAGTFLLRELGRLARSSGAHLLSALLPGEGSAHRSLRDAGYRRVPERLHPQVIRFSVRGLGPFAGRRELFDGSAWQLSWADTDVV